MEKKNVKIVVSGHVGSGKTSLVKALAKKFDLPIIEEDLKDIYTAFGNYRRLNKSSVKAISELVNARNAWIKTFFHWANKRRNLYEYYADRGFVADRWEADLVDTWLKCFVDFKCDDLTVKLFNDMKNKALLMDYAIILPLKTSVVEEINEYGMKRKQSFNLKLMSSLLTYGLIKQCPNLPLIIMPNETMTVEERVDYVLKSINEHAQQNKHRGQA